jgi:hypothetical protein
MKRTIVIASLLATMISAKAQVAPNLASSSNFGILSGGIISATNTVLGDAGATTSISALVTATTQYTGGAIVTRH